MLTDPLLRWGYLIRLDPTTDCKIWTGATNGRTGGKVRYEGKTHYVTRLVYSFYKGDVPKGMYVLHTCDLPACVNPEHLWLGTQRDNMNDMYNKGRRACVSVEDTEALRQGTMTMGEAISKYGYTMNSIQRVIAGSRR